MFLVLAFAINRVGQLTFLRMDDGVHEASRGRRRCCLVSFYALIVPGLVILSIMVLLVVRRFGGPPVVAYGGFLTIASWAWILASIVGLLFAIRASYLVGGVGDELILVVLHVISLFVIIIAPYARYIGHPD